MKPELKLSTRNRCMSYYKVKCPKCHNYIAVVSHIDGVSDWWYEFKNNLYNPDVALAYCRFCGQKLDWEFTQEHDE